MNIIIKGKKNALNLSQKQFILNNLMFDVIRFQQQFLKRSMKIIKRYHKIKA